MDTLKHQRLKAEVPQTLNVMEIVDGGTRAHVPEMADHEHPIARCRTGDIHEQFIVEGSFRGQVLRVLKISSAAADPNRVVGNINLG